MSGAPASSIAFDRVADRYDESRGGVQRAEPFAAALAPHLPRGRTVLEVGVGTGIVAEQLRRRGVRVVGADLSAPMLAIAAGRLPGLVAQADALRLPFGGGSLDCVYEVWLLHLVADVASVLAEVARVLRPGGRFLALASDADADGCDLEEIAERLRLALRDGAAKQDEPRLVAAAAAGHGLRESEQLVVTTQRDWPGPRGFAARLSERVNSWLWDVEPERWQSVVEPALAELAALPDQDRPRRVRQTFPLQVFERL